MITNLRTTISPLGKSIVATALAWAPACTLAQTHATASQLEKARAFTVRQGVYGCLVSTTDDGDPSTTPDLTVPFRGGSIIRFVVEPPPYQVLSVNTERALIKFNGGPDISVRLSWFVQMNPRTHALPKQIAFVELEKDTENKLRNALLNSTEATVQVGDKGFGIVLPSSSFWKQADECKAKVGEALLKATPPTYMDGSAVNRDAPFPRTDPRRRIDSSSYPSQAVQMKAQGDVRVALGVDRYGYTISCNIAQSSGFPILDDRTCKLLLSRARFYPALNGTGQAIDGKWQTNIKWRMPG